MRGMDFLAVLLVMIVTITACQIPQDKQQSRSMQTGMVLMTSDSADSHMGCQENEIDDDGICRPAVSNNAELFGQDLDAYVKSETIKDEFTGYLAYPRLEGNYPGVILIHEWWGLNDNIKEMAKLLAKEGYVVFAIDLYDGEVANNSTVAMRLMGSVRDNPVVAIEKMKLATRYLKEERKVDKIASMGWCFGGGQSLQLALNENLDATVIYYGQLVDDQSKLSNIKWPVLGIFGENDTGIKVEAVKKFKSDLEALDIKNDIYIYRGVGHAFANPSGSNYAKRETVDAWNKTIAFLDENLKD